MYLSKEHCYECKKVTDHHNGKCSECASKKHAESEAAWKALSVDEKIEALRRAIDNLEIRDMPIR